MKILFLANRTPYPPYRGDKLKIFNLAKRLKDNHELHLLTFAQTEEDLTYKAELEKIFTKVDFIYLPKWKSVLNCISGLWTLTPLQVLYFHSPAMRRKLAQVLEQEKFDAVHVQHLRMSPYMINDKSVGRVLDMPDAFSLYWKRRTEAEYNPLIKFFNNTERKRVLKYEQVMKEYDMSLVCSREDREYLLKTHNITGINLLPNGVDLTTFRAGDHDYSHNHTLLFTGNMDYAPNVDAVQYFVQDIFPSILEKHPQVKFIIAGQKPVKKVLELASENVIVTGFVKDLAAVYNSASVVVAPLRFGAGTQNKVLEAMAMGVPVVCSHIGFEGLGINSGDGAYMKQDAKEFAATVNHLLASADERHRVGQTGEQVIRNNFGWDAIALMLGKYLAEVAKK